MANVSDIIDTDDPSLFLRQVLQEQGADSAASVVTRHLLFHGAATGSEIVTGSRLSRASVSMALIDLRSRGVVYETSVDGPSKTARGRGRPQMKQSISAGIGLVAGVKFGTREVRISLSDAAHNRLADVILPVETGYGPAEARQLLEEKLEQLISNHNTSVSEMLGIGLAIAAPVKPDGIVPKTPGLQGWNNANLRELFADHFPCAIHADNELNCAAQSKMQWGAARDLEDFVYVSFDYEIGGVIVYDGKIRRGVEGQSAEIGHIPIDHPGKICRCGKAGCLETIASIEAVLESVTGALGETVDYARLEQLLGEGNKVAISVVDQAAQRCGQALAMISSILSPSHYLLDGKLTGLGSPFQIPLNTTFSNHSNGQLPRILDVTGSFDDSVRGAAGLVFSSQRRINPTSI